MKILQYISKIYNSIFHTAPAAIPAATSSITVRAPNGITLAVIKSFTIMSTDDNGNLKLSALQCKFDRLRIGEIFNRNYFAINAQRYPLQIEMNSADYKIIINNAWITNVDYVYQTPDYVIVSKMELEAESAKTIELKG